MSTVKIHVHPTPTHSDYDYHLPFHGLVYNVDTYCKSVRKLTPAVDEIVLTSNGEPDQRLTLTFNTLRQEFNNVKIQNKPTCYEENDCVFFNQSFVNLPKPSKNFQEIIDHYLSTYKLIPFVRNNNSPAFRGFHNHHKQIWFHYGRGMPVVSNKSYQILNYLLEPVFLDLVHCLQKKFSQIGIDFDVENNLILRLNHSQPDSQTDFDPEFFLLPHLDTSILSAWVWTSHPGATLYQDQSGNVPVEVRELHDQNHEYCIIPGLDYCDFSSSMKRATWHGVRDHGESQHRVAIVGFLRQPVYLD
jgi:hypothetical protein